LKSNPDILSDTVSITLVLDTFNIYLGINYLCETPFKVESTISNDSVLIAITDTCSHDSGGCYAWCMCFYTWNFQFWKGDLDSCYYKIELISPREGESRIIQAGYIDLK
jgi:hypothetical protein